MKLTDIDPIGPVAGRSPHGERGLKPVEVNKFRKMVVVAPLTGSVD